MKASIFLARVFHKRHIPKKNAFSYRVYYVALPLSKLFSSDTTSHLPINRPALISFHEQDHGPKDSTALLPWIRTILAGCTPLDVLVKEVVLVAVPRIFGYVFNPVSFWLCLDEQNQLRAVLCEVNNTFGETHSYLCYHPDYRPITKKDWLYADKHFHVSPFLPRKGWYQFRFSYHNTRLAIWIDYYHENGQKQLTTSMIGHLHTLAHYSVYRAFWRYPLLTFKVIFLIHWQALKLLSKGIPYFSKPKPLQTQYTKTKKR